MSNNDRKPASRTPAPSRTLDSYFPSRFLKVADFIAWKLTEIKPIIARVTEEEVQPEPDDVKEWKLVLYFTTKAGGELPKGYLVSNKTDKEALKAATGALAALDLVGKRIRVHVDTWRKKSVLRIDPAPVTAAAAIPTPAATTGQAIAERTLAALFGEPEPNGAPLGNAGSSTAHCTACGETLPEHAKGCKFEKF